MQLGEFVKKMTPSNMLVVLNAAGQTIYRGYAANFNHAGISDRRQIKGFELGMETYKKTETMWDWMRVDTLPEQLPVEVLSQYDTAKLSHIIYTKVKLED